jgi:nitrate/nitrite-specific signal transduction histidine kinase
MHSAWNRQFVIRKLQHRLLLSYVLVALIPILAISITSIAIGYGNAQKQTHDRLQSVMLRKELELTAWLDDLNDDLVTLSAEEYMMARIQVVLDLWRDQKYLEYYNKVLQARFQRRIEQTSRFDEIFLVDLQGNIPVSTSLEQRSIVADPQLLRAMQTPRPFVVLIPGTRDPPGSWSEARAPATVFVAIPVFADGVDPVGFLTGSANLDRLVAIFHDPTGIGATGRTYLANSESVFFEEAGILQLLASDQSLPQEPQHCEGDTGREPAEQFVQGTLPRDGEASGTFVVSMCRWIPQLQHALFVQQDRTEAFSSTMTTLRTTLWIVCIGLLGAIGAALLTARTISSPITRLARVAQRVANGGDFEYVQDVRRQDELGVLATAFNRMVTRLQHLITGLEDDVAARTQSLRHAVAATERRAVQLETSARVSREITSILSIDHLIERVIELIQCSFDYHHVTIHLLAQAEEEPRALQLQITPDDWTELVFPLVVGGQKIGTLNVLHSDASEFRTDDIMVLQSLADQIAVAIHNARLYERSEELAILKERNRLARDLHDAVTQSIYSLVTFAGAGRRMLEHDQPRKVHGYLERIERNAQQALKEMRLLLYELRPPCLNDEGFVGAIQQRLNAVERRAGISASVIIDGEVSFPLYGEKDLYYIIQEALNNALKHASAQTIIVRLQGCDDGVCLEISDDGLGFDPEEIVGAGGMGLASIQERALALGCPLTINSGAGSGTRISMLVQPPYQTAHRRHPVTGGGG